MGQGRDRRDRARSPGPGASRTPSPASSRASYRGPGRFRHAGAYEVEREWRRYEGTPQRELLRGVRERFLERALRTASEEVRWAAEVGPGPGRFTPLVGQGAERLLLVDLSTPMLRAAAERVEAGSGPSSEGGVDLVQADASRSPLKERSLDRVVALGNLVGFAGPRARSVLEGLARAVAPGGALVFETQAAVTFVPRFLDEAGPPELRRTFVSDPRHELPRLLREGWRPVPPPKPAGREGSGDIRGIGGIGSLGGLGGTGPTFRFMARSEVSHLLSREGLNVVDELVAAPLLGGSPELLDTLLRSGGPGLRALLRWEETVGREREFLEAGGHLLTCAVRD